MNRARATAFAPGTVGNVGPGFDVLGLAFEGLGDRVTVELCDGPSQIVEISGRDADQIPRDPERNAAVIAARALLARQGSSAGVRVWLEKGLPASGGLGGSAASSVAGALAAWAAWMRGAGANPEEEPKPYPALIESALAAETAVAGRHLDNIASCLLGGLVLVRSSDPVDLVSIPVAADWWVALVTPALRVETRAARAILPEVWERSGWIAQMANTTALSWAFASGDAQLARRALEDHYAEPVRGRRIPHFAQVKADALRAGAMGCSLSGSGPTVFALAPDRPIAQVCADAMVRAFVELPATSHVARIARKGARIERE